MQRISQVLITIIWAMTLAMFASACGKKKGEETPAGKSEPAAGEQPRKADPARPDPARPDPARPDPARPDPARPGTETPRTRPDPARPDPARPDPAQPDPARAEPTRPADRPSGPPPEQAEIPTGAKMNHGDCNTAYRAGTKNFRNKNFEGAVQEFVRFVSGQCFDRTTRSTDAWLSYRAFHSTCATSTHQYQRAFKKLLIKACAKYGSDRTPCSQSRRCKTGKTVDRSKCNAAYRKGTAAARSGDNQAALDAFTEFDTMGCFGRITKSTDQWAAYRAMKAADALGKPKDAFVERLKTACKTNPNWACRKGLGK